jgi:hypothetical protein
MTRRYPQIPAKVARRDAKIAKKLMVAWDVEHDKDKVLTIFMQHCHLLSDYRYWELLRTVWIICGSTGRASIFRGLMSSNRKHRNYFSTPEEHAFLEALPNEFDVYRAQNTSGDDNGLSWTLHKEYAMGYSEMFNKSHIKIRNIYKDDVFAYINRNKESEIIIL